MPDSHRLNFHYIDGEARFTEPLSRSVGVSPTSFQAIAWSSAIAEAAAKLKSISPSQIAIIASGRMTNEELFLTRALASEIGTSHLSLVPRFAEPDALLIAADRNPNTTGAKLVLETEDPYAKLDAIRVGVRNGEIKALIVLGEDLITDAGFHFSDLAKLDFLLQSHILANPTALAAHLVLPAAAFAEKRGSMVNLSGRLQRLNRAVEMPGQAHDDWEILRDLILAMTGEKNEVHHIEDVFKALAEAVPTFNGLTLSKIGHQGTPITDTGYKIPLLENERARKAAGQING
jgi:NADH-quinone oxidoreductase subunit G